MPVWTDEQKLAIELRNRRLLVSAAAGSGKTAVLTERIFRRITDPDRPMDIDRLLVMTFTRAAASEMRERILKRVEDAMTGARGRQLEHLRRQAGLLDSAKITTIDSFCLNLIRENTDRLEVDPGFRVGNQEELTLLCRDAAAEVLEECCGEEDQEFFRLMRGFKDRQGDGPVLSMLLFLNNFAESRPWPEEWIEDCRREAAGMAETGESPAYGWQDYLLQCFRTLGHELVQACDKALDLCDSPGGPETYMDVIKAERKGFRDLSGVRTLSEAREQLLLLTGWAKQKPKKKTDDEEKVAAVNALRDFWKKRAGAFRDAFCPEEETLSKEIEGEGRTIEALLQVLTRLRERIKTRKQEKNLLDFSDIEHLCLQLLWEKTPEGERRRTVLAEEYAESFSEIYVDEYQDSNEVQEQLLLALDRGAMFLVGDVKQSIYAFRQARPELFGRRYETYVPVRAGTEVPEGTDTRVDLSKNFRSRPEVLSSTNRVFSRLMDRPVGGIVYDSDAALYPGATFPDLDKSEKEDYRTELLVTEVGSGSEESREQEAETIADRILELTDPETGLLVSDPKKGGVRRAEFRDIVILLRSMKGRAEQLVEVLMRRGIPAEAEQNTGYFDALEVRTVLALLAAADNPMQDIPLAAVLLSPIGGLTEEELSSLLKAEDEESCLYLRLKKCLPDGEAAAAVDTGAATYENGNAADDHASAGAPAPARDGAGRAREKLAALFKLLRELSLLSVTEPLPELLRAVYERTGYDSYVSALPGGEVRLANLEMLLVRAEDFERTGYRGLYDFIRYIDILKDYETDFGEANPSVGSGNSVRIMSIHRSKGLEFPVVITASLSKQFNRTELNARVIADQDFGLAADCFDFALHTRGSGLRKTVFARHKKAEMCGEELRILYVAMTRAKEKLILSAVLPDAAEALEAAGNLAFGDLVTSEEILSAQSQAAWILKAMARDQDLCGIRMDVRPASAISQEQETAEGAMQAFRERLLKETEEASGEAAAELMSLLEKPYRYQEDVSLIGKRSVSELKFRGMEEDLEGAETPDWLKEHLEQQAGPEQGALSGAARGTVFHRVMELLPYTSIDSGDAFLSAVEGLKTDGTFLPEEADCVKGRAFLPFYHSGLFARMKEAELRGDLHREAPFVMTLPAREIEPGLSSEEPVMIQGVIDAWFREGDGLVLLDYKTDRVGSEEELSERYRLQLDFYRKALEKMTGETVKEQLLWSFCLNREIRL